MNSYSDLKDRSETPAYKSNKTFLKKMFNDPEVLPLWVADMDFEVSTSIKEAVNRKIDFGILGYEFKTDSQIESIMTWYATYNNWDFDKESIRFAPGILTGISVAINKLTKEGDGVIIQPPVYSPFSEIIKSSNRSLVENALILDNGKYVIDFEDLEKKSKDPKNKMILLCNPHNPVGRVWTKEELARIGEIAVENDLIILSDDIHADIVYKEYQYTAMASLSEAISKRTITFLSPGKTFNTSGISTAVIVTSNDEYGKHMDEFFETFYIGHVPNALSMVAFEAGYRNSRDWFEETMTYIRGNLDYVKSIIDDIDGVRLIEPEGTYLIWLDLRELKLRGKELQDYLVKEAKLGLNYGHWFGKEGDGFVRLNLATSRENIIKAFDNLKNAVKNLK